MESGFKLGVSNVELRDNDIAITGKNRMFRSHDLVSTTYLIIDSEQC